MNLVQELKAENGSSNEEEIQPVRDLTSKCEICKQNNHKYKCPGCSMKTCCLDCCRKHKEQFSCTGERDRTKFVPKSQFDENLLLSDYKFLEENNLLVDTFQRNNIDQTEQKQQQNFGSYENLRKFLYKNFNINLKLMPSESTRHLNNKTRFNKTSNLVSWSIEFLFFSPAKATHDLQSKQNSSKNNYVKLDTKSALFSCKDTVREILKKFFKKFKLELTNNEKNLAMCNLFCLNALSVDEASHVDRVLGDLSVLYEIADHNSKKKYFIEFEMDETLEECLRNKTVIEFPSLHLVKQGHLNQFDIKIEEKRERTVNETVDGDGDKSPVIISEDHKQLAEPEHAFKVPKPPTVVTKTSSSSLEDGEVEDGEVDDDDEDDYTSEAKKVKLDSN
jgi:hypothetical protein